MVHHSVDASCDDKVTRAYDELLHQSSIQNDGARSKAKSLRRGLVEGLSEAKIYHSLGFAASDQCSAPSRMMTLPHERSGDEQPCAECRKCNPHKHCNT